jgi:protein PhnA
MARGRELHAARLGAINALGKTLTRRARSRCELCGLDHGLAVVEIEPVDEVPHEDAAILACAACRDALAGRLPEANALRFLDTAVWQDPLPVKVAAIALLRRLAEAEVGWARDTLDGLWLDETVQAQLDRLA